MVSLRIGCWDRGTDSKTTPCIRGEEPQWRTYQPRPIRERGGFAAARASNAPQPRGACAPSLYAGPTAASWPDPSACRNFCAAAPFQRQIALSRLKGTAPLDQDDASRHRGWIKELGMQGCFFRAFVLRLRGGKVLHHAAFGQPFKAFDRRSYRPLR